MDTTFACIPLLTATLFSCILGKTLCTSFMVEPPLEMFIEFLELALS